MWNEARAAGELSRLIANPVYRGIDVERGDGRLVLVLPGLFANDLYLQPLHTWLKRIGYTPVRSTLLVNAGCPQRLCEEIEGHLRVQMSTRPGPVAIIGHSRGGILARALAIRLGERTSHLVLLGSPVGAISRVLTGGITSPAAPPVVRAGNRARQWLDPDCDAPNCGCPFPADLTQPMSKATRVLSIFSPDDPIVPAWACKMPGARNIEVRGTHSGLVYNVAGYREIAKALAQH